MDGKLVDTLYRLILFFIKLEKMEGEVEIERILHDNNFAKQTSSYGFNLITHPIVIR